jgi:hypothetical protein
MSKVPHMLVSVCGRLASKGPARKRVHFHGRKRERRPTFKHHAACVHRIYMCVTAPGVFDGSLYARFLDLSCPAAPRLVE